MMDTGVYTVTVDVDPLPQSSGKVLEGGDCGLCCIAGIFRLESIEAAYEYLEKRMPEEGGWKRRASLDAVRRRFLFEHLGGEPFLPPFDHYKDGMAEVPWDNCAWRDEFKKLVKDGTVILASIRFDKHHPPPPRSYEHETDHAVILNGWRQYWKDHPKVRGAKSMRCEVGVSCSVKGRYWVEWSELLYYYGFNGVTVTKAVHGREPRVEEADADG